MAYDHSLADRREREIEASKAWAMKQIASTGLHATWFPAEQC